VLYVLALLADHIDSSARRSHYLSLMFWPPVLIGVGFPLVTGSRPAFVFVVLSASAVVGWLVCRRRGRRQETVFLVRCSFIYVLLLVGGIAGWLGTQGL
jgi:hypothetical protein